MIITCYLSFLGLHNTAVYKNVYFSRIQENPPENEVGDSGEFSSAKVTVGSPSIAELTTNQKATNPQILVFVNIMVKLAAVI